jgi:hypothetical protein
MLKYLWIAPVVLLAGCSKSNVPASQPAQVGYAQPARVDAGARAPQPLAGNPEPVAPREAPPVVAPEPAPDGSADRVAPSRSAAVIPSGTPLHVRVDESIDTRRNRAGDGFTATLTQPIQMEGRVVVPAGTEFRGHVTNASTSGRMKGRASLGLALDSFHLNGRQYRVQTTSVDRVSASHKKRNSWLIGGGAGLGAAIGAIAGGGKGALIGAGAGAGAGTAGAAVTGKKDVGIAAETPLRFTLRSAVEL